MGEQQDFGTTNGVPMVSSKTNFQLFSKPAKTRMLQLLKWWLMEGLCVIQEGL